MRCVSATMASNSSAVAHPKVRICSRAMIGSPSESSFRQNSTSVEEQRVALGQSKAGTYRSGGHVADDHLDRDDLKGANQLLAFVQTPNEMRRHTRARQAAP